MMRFVSYYSRATSDLSGVTESLWSWAAALTDAGQEVVVLHAGGTRRSPDRRHERPNLRDETVRHRGSGRATFRPIRLDRYLRPDDILILHEGWVLSNVIAARAAQRVGCRYIIVPHGVYEPGIRRMLRQPRWIREVFERRLIERAAAVHVFFETEIPLARDVGPRLRDAVVAPNGFTVGDERWVGGGGYLAWIGRYDPPHKGLDILLRAMAALGPTERPRLELRGPDYNGGYATVLEMIRSFGLETWVHAEGPMHGSAKHEFLRRADAYVMPSRWDSHPIALTENLGLGVPCLVSSGMHIAKPLAAAGAAIIAEPSDEGLADGLRRLAVADHAALSERARAFVRDSFAWPIVTAAFIDGMERVTKRDGAEANLPT